jgi:hypothetical protein
MTDTEITRHSRGVLAAAAALTAQLNGRDPRVR